MSVSFLPTHVGDDKLDCEERVLDCIGRYQPDMISAMFCIAEPTVRKIQLAPRVMLVSREFFLLFVRGTATSPIALPNTAPAIAALVTPVNLFDIVLLLFWFISVLFSLVCHENICANLRLTKFTLPKREKSVIFLLT